MDLTAEQIAALQAKAAKAEQLEAALAEARDNIASARKIHAAYEKIKQGDERAGAYLNALAKGDEPAKFWETTVAPTTEPTDPAAYDPESLERRLTQHMEAQVQALTDRLSTLVQQKFEAVARPVLSMQQQRAEESVRQWVQEKYPNAKWDEFKKAMPDLAKGNASLTEDEHGLQLLFRAWFADQGEQLGYQRAKTEQATREQLRSSLRMPAFNGGDAGVDGDPFAGIEETDLQGMQARIEQMALNGR